MKLSFTITTEKMIENCCDDLYDIYYFLNQGFNSDFNWSDYKDSEVLITNYRDEYPLTPPESSGSLFYTINFEKDESQIFVESYANDIQLYSDGVFSDEQAKILDNLIENQRISVKDLIVDNMQNKTINFLFGFCVDYIQPSEIFSWSVYTMLNETSNPRTQLLFNTFCL